MSHAIKTHDARWHKSNLDSQKRKRERQGDMDGGMIDHY